MNKKSAVITFRTSEDVKMKLEQQAQQFGWSISQLIETILTEKIEDQEDIQEMLALELLKEIESKKIRSTADITRWAIKNRCVELISMSIDMWQAVIREVEGKDPIIQNERFVPRTTKLQKRQIRAYPVAWRPTTNYKTTKIAKS